MKRIYSFRSLIAAVLVVAGFSAFAQPQVVHPVTYSSGVAGNTNYFINFVGILGERFIVTYPPAIEGPKVFTTPNTNTAAAGTWGGYPGVAPASAIVFPIDTVITYSQDSCVATSTTITINMTGRVAMVYRGAGVQFGTKALSCQIAGAVACVIVNNVDGGPVGMAAGSYGTSVTIPVFMISKADGNAINSQIYNGVPVTINVVNWTQGNLDDLGLVDGGLAQWHNGAIPYYELAAGGNPMAYMGFDGAYTANFGSQTEYNVKLVANTSFTPTGSEPISIYNDSVTLDSFQQMDSIWAMFCHSYNMEQYITGTGTINVNYGVSFTDITGAPVVDQFPADNYSSYSVNVTDNVYCKGRYDMVHNVPFCATYYDAGPTTSGGSIYNDYLWGPMFYINSGRYADSATFSVVRTAGTDTSRAIPAGSSVTLYLLKWVDGSGSIPADGLVENEELQMAGIAIKTFAAGDRSFNYFTAAFTDSGGTVYGRTKLSDTSWYWLAADMPCGGTSTIWSLGADGFNNGYPRLYGRYKFPDSTMALNYFEAYASVWESGNRGGTGAEGTTMFASPNYLDDMILFGGTYWNYDLDSTIFANTKGLIPNISMTTQMWPTRTSQPVLPTVDINLYPNPTSENISVKLTQPTVASNITYKIINTAGNVFTIENHQNVSNDVFTYNTNKLASGIYYLIVIDGDRPMFRKFTVIH